MYRIDYEMIWIAFRCERTMKKAWVAAIENEYCFVHLSSNIENNGKNWWWNTMNSIVDVT